MGHETRSSAQSALRPAKFGHQVGHGVKRGHDIFGHQSATAGDSTHHLPKLVTNVKFVYRSVTAAHGVTNLVTVISYVVGGRTQRAAIPTPEK
jgi:hypothetical protein